MKALTPVLLIVLAGAITWLYLAPRYEQVRADEIVNEVYEQYIAQAKDLLEREAKLQSDLAGIPDFERAKILTILPDERDVPELLARLNQIVEGEEGVELLEVSFEREVEESDQRNRRSASEDIEEAKPYKRISATLALSATYNQFISLMNRMENSQLLVDVRSVNIEPGTEDTSTTATAQTQGGVYVFSVLLDSYILK